MANFNYSHLRFFDANGTELPLVYNAPIVTIDNPSHKDEYSEYIVIRTSPDDYISDENFSYNVDLKNVKTGKRFKGNEKVTGSYKSDEQEINDVYIYPSSIQYIDYQSIKGNEKYLTINLTDKKDNVGFWSRFTNKGLEIDKIPFPSYTFNTRLTFDKVSTNLIETQSIFILVNNPTFTATDESSTKFTTVYDLAQCAGYEDVNDFMDRYQLMFFIDCREHNNFKFFTTDGDEVVWSDRYFIDFKNDNTVAVGSAGSGFRVDIGFMGELDGLYEETLHVILIDKSKENVDEDYPGDAYFIGTIDMVAETEGEDERYRTFFENFGLPDPKYTNDAFADSDINETSPDYISINNHSKKLFLAYDQIFPYAGSYKALINALNLLGYNDIFFKEWYKEIGSTPNKGYVSFDMSYNHNKNANTISSVPLEERIQLKKLNWISMMYKMNEETSEPLDKFGFPSVSEKSNYYTNGTLVKLISLKKYLEKYVLGVNCRITDIGGEGIVFERYNTINYGTYQQVFEFVNEKGLSIEIDKPVNTTHSVNKQRTQQSDKTINIKLNTSNSYVKLSDLESLKFSDYCEGYFDESSNFIKNPDKLIDCSNYIYYGKTVELNNNSDTFEVRCLGKPISFRLDNEFIAPNTTQLIIDDGTIFFDPIQVEQYGCNTAFNPNNLPIIQAQECIIKHYKNEISGEIDKMYYVSTDYNINDTVSFNVKDENGDIISTLKDVLTLLPPVYGDAFVTPSTASKYSYKTSDGTEHYRYYGIYDEQIDSTVSYSDVRNANFGLRYTADNIHSIPCFKMIGYKASEYNTVNNKMSKLPLNSEHEYFIEILEGKLIFLSGDKKISINFSHNENTNATIVDVSLMTLTQFPVLYKYNNGENQSVSNFINGHNYSTFTNIYNNYKYDDAIIYKSEHSISVNHAGEYKVNAIVYDEFNNAFNSSNTKTINITQTKPKLIQVMSSANDVDVETKTYDKTPDIDLTNCRFKYTPKRNIISTKIRSNHELYDGDIDAPIYHIEGKYASDAKNGILVSDNPIEGKYAQISNTTDRFVYGGHMKLDDVDVLILYKKCSNDGHIYTISPSDYKNILYCYDTNLKYNNASKSDLLNILKIYKNKEKLYDTTYGTMADVNLSIYNSVSEQLYMQIPGMIVPATNDEYGSKYYFIQTVDVEDVDIKTILSGKSNKIYDIFITPTWVLKTTHNFNNRSELEIITDSGYNKFPFTNKLKYNTLLKLSYHGHNDIVNDYFGHNIMIMDTKNGTMTENNLSDTKLYPKNNIATHNTEDSSLYISPIDQNNVSYTMKLSNKEPMFTNTIHAEDTKINKTISQHIDAGFTVSVRNFDINNAHESIVDKMDTESIFIYEINENEKFPHLETNETIVLSLPKISISESQNKQLTVQWKVYKQNKYTNNPTLYFETYTTCDEYIGIKLKNKGIYDLEISGYDEYGNKYERYISSAFIIK